MMDLRLSLRKPVVVSVTVEFGLLKVLLGREREVLAHRIVPLTPRYFREGLIGNRDAVAGIVRTAVQEIDGKGRVSAAVPGFQTLLWVLGLPPANDMDPGVVIPQDANRRMGVSVETSQMKWRRLPDRLDRRRWLVVSATRRSLATLPEMLDRAGLKLRYLELRPFALARAVNQPDAMIVSTYAEGCDVVVVRDATPMAYTGVYWGVEALDGPTLVNRLAEAASRTVAVFNQNTLEDPLPDDVPVYVFGTQIGREAGIASQVASVLQRPAGEIAPPVTCPPDLPVQDLMVNIGLLLALA